MQTDILSQKLDFPVQPSEIVEWDETFDLFVLFSMSNTPQFLVQGSHGYCVDFTRTMIKFMMREHEVHYRGYEFTTTVRPSMRAETCIVVMKQKVTQMFPTSQLHATFEIRKHIDKSEYDNPKGGSKRTTGALLVGGVSKSEATGENSLKGKEWL